MVPGPCTVLCTVHHKKRRVPHPGLDGAGFSVPPPAEPDDFGLAGIPGCCRPAFCECSRVGVCCADDPVPFSFPWASPYENLASSWFGRSVFCEMYGVGRYAGKKPVRYDLTWTSRRGKPIFCRIVRSHDSCIGMPRPKRRKAERYVRSSLYPTAFPVHDRPVISDSADSSGSPSPADTGKAPGD